MSELQIKALHGRLKEVSDLLLEGMNNTEIAKELGIKVRTVKAYIRRLNFLYDVSNRCNLAIKLFKPNNSDRPMMPSMTRKQMNVANYIASGLSNGEISAKTGCTYNTTRNVIRDLFDVCGVWSRLELTLFILHHRGANSDAN